MRRWQSVGKELFLSVTWEMEIMKSCNTQFFSNRIWTIPKILKLQWKDTYQPIRYDSPAFILEKIGISFIYSHWNFNTIARWLAPKNAYFIQTWWRDRYALTVTQKFTHEGKPIGRAKMFYSVICLDLALTQREMGYILQNSEKFLDSEAPIQIRSKSMIPLHEYETHYLHRPDRLSKIPKIINDFKFLAPKLDNLSARLIER